MTCVQRKLKCPWRTLRVVRHKFDIFKEAFRRLENIGIMIHRVIVRSGWNPPLSGIIKLNSDATLRVAGSFLGIMARDDAKDLLEAQFSRLTRDTNNIINLILETMCTYACLNKNINNRTILGENSKDEQENGLHSFAENSSCFEVLPFFL